MRTDTFVKLRHGLREHVAKMGLTGVGLFTVMLLLADFTDGTVTISLEQLATTVGMSKDQVRRLLKKLIPYYITVIRLGAGRSATTYAIPKYFAHSGGDRVGMDATPGMARRNPQGWQEGHFSGGKNASSNSPTGGMDATSRHCNQGEISELSALKKDPKKSPEEGIRSPASPACQAMPSAAVRELTGRLGGGDLAVALDSALTQRLGDKSALFGEALAWRVETDAAFAAGIKSNPWRYLAGRHRCFAAAADTVHKYLRHGQAAAVTPCPDHGEDDDLGIPDPLADYHPGAKPTQNGGEAGAESKDDI